jgi:hypothetical protein
VLVVMAGCSGGSSSAATHGKPDPYDVSAARACAALDRFVNDIRNDQPRQADSTAFETSLAALANGHPATARWGPLVADLQNFLDDGESQNMPNLVADGQAAGQLCQTIPQSAKAAGGFA